MFLTLMNIRLLIIDSCNELADDERATTAAAWVDILDMESSRLIESTADWEPIAASVLDCDPAKLNEWQRKARLLGRADARLSLILADQIVAALIRGHLQGVQT